MERMIDDRFYVLVRHTDTDGDCQLDSPIGPLSCDEAYSKKFSIENADKTLLVRVQRGPPQEAK